MTLDGLLQALIVVSKYKPAAQSNGTGAPNVHIKYFPQLQGLR